MDYTHCSIYCFIKVGYIVLKSVLVRMRGHGSYIPCVYRHAVAASGSGARWSGSLLAVFNRRVTSFTKVDAISPKPGSAILSVTHRIPDSEQMERYDFGPTFISSCVAHTDQTNATDHDIPNLTNRCQPDVRWDLRIL